MNKEQAFSFEIITRLRKENKELLAEVERLREEVELDPDDMPYVSMRGEPIATFKMMSPAKLERLHKIEEAAKDIDEYFLPEEDDEPMAPFLKKYVMALHEALEGGA